MFIRLGNTTAAHGKGQRERQRLVSMTCGIVLRCAAPSSLRESMFTVTGSAQPGWRWGNAATRDEACWRPVSWNSRARAGGREEAAAGVTMARDICHAWLHSPLLTMGPGDQPVVSFFSLPSFPGTLLSLTMGLLCPLRFLPTFNPSGLLLFLPLLSVST